MAIKLWFELGLGDSLVWTMSKNSHVSKLNFTEKKQSSYCKWEDMDEQNRIVYLQTAAQRTFALFCQLAIV